MKFFGSIFLMVFMVLAINVSAENTTGTIEIKYASIIDPINGEEEYVLIRNNYTSPTLQFIMNYDGSIIQLRDDTGTSLTIERKIAFLTNTKLQLESVKSIDEMNLYGRQWQLPKNASVLVTQYKLDELGLPKFDEPHYYALTATSNTLIVLQWIRSGFDLYAFSKPHFIQMYWNDNTESDLSHYNVYRSDTNTTGTFTMINDDPILISRYSDFEDIEKGKTYYYKTTAVDTSGNESAFSNVAKVKMPEGSNQ